MFTVFIYFSRDKFHYMNLQSIAGIYIHHQDEMAKQTVDTVNSW